MTNKKTFRKPERFFYSTTASIQLWFIEKLKAGKYHLTNGCQCLYSY